MDEVDYRKRTWTGAAARGALLMWPAIFAGAALGCTCSGVVGRQGDAGSDGAPIDAPSLDAPPVDAPRPDVVTTDATCASVVLDTTPVIPSVIFVTDRSGSMNTRFVYPDGPTKWEILREALLGIDDPGDPNDVEGVVTALQDEVRFGLALYYQDAYADIAVVGCPQMITTPAVVSGRAAIDHIFAVHAMPWGNDPTGAAIQYVVGNTATLVPSRDDGPTVIVLATDGDGASCENIYSIPIGRMRTLEAVQAAHAAGINTYALSLASTDDARAHLQDVANAGLGVAPGQPDAMVFEGGTDAGALADAFRAIVRRVVTCELELDGMILPQYACDGTVTLGSDTLTCGTDWRAVDATHIELLGDACTRLQSGSGDELLATFPCTAIPF